MARLSCTSQGWSFSPRRISTPRGSTISMPRLRAACAPLHSTMSLKRRLVSPTGGRLAPTDSASCSRRSLGSDTYRSVQPLLCNAISPPMPTRPHPPHHHNPPHPPHPPPP